MPISCAIRFDIRWRLCSIDQSSRMNSSDGSST